jgi:ligand-binding sensor domain-containing protein
MRLHLTSHWLLIFFPMFFCPAAKAQLPGMKIYTQLDGYPGTTGYHISQDVKGFIWVSTNNGAACFDGKRFRVVDNKDGLIDKEILYALPYGQEDVLLMPILNNLALYKNGRIITAAQNKNLSLISNKMTNFCTLDKVTGKLWLSDSRNMTGMVYCFTGDSIREVKIKMPVVFDILAVVNNLFYLRTFEEKKGRLTSIGTYDLKSRIYTPCKFVYPNGKRIDSTELSYGRISNDGKYFIAAHKLNQVAIYEIKRHEFRHLRTLALSQPLRFLYTDKNNHLWITLSTSGIEYWGSLSGPEIRHKPLYLLENIVVNSLFADRDDNLWFSTEQKGLCFISDRHWQNARLVLQLKLPPYPPNSVSGDGNSSIYIGHSGKPCFTHIKNGSSTVFSIPGGSPLGVRNILKINEHIFASSNVLATFIEKTNGITYKSMWNSSRAIKDLAVYSNKQLVIAEHSAVIAVKIKDLDKSLEYAKNVFEGRASSVEILPDSSLLVGTPNGLFLKPSLYEPAVRINHSILKSAHITDINNARENFVLIGTSAQGLHLYHSLTGITSPVPFPANNNSASVRQIFRQNDSIYWISTDKGIAKMLFGKNMKLSNIATYTFFDGLPSNDVTSVYVQHDTAYVATAAGLGILPLKNPLKKSKAPALWLNSIKIEDSLVYFPKGKIDLPHHQNNIQLSLSALSYESMGTLKFEFRLLGLSKKWRETESPEISFSGLAPGEYQFEAYALNAEGVRLGSPLLVSIIVHPAFWQTAWFRASFFILVGSLALFIVYRLIIQKKNKQYHQIQQKRRLAELELEAIKAQINPHFVYNCLNSIQYFSYKNDFEPVKQYLDIFAKLIRQTMQYSQETFITLEEEINYLGNYLKLEKVRFKDKLNYELEIAEDLDLSVLIPSMLIQPYVENALKHGVAKSENMGRVRIHFSRARGKCLQVTIEDNGPGLHKKIAGGDRKPLGLRLSSSRAETYNQLFGLDIGISLEPRELFNDDGTKGTRIKLIIPPIKHGNTTL